METVPHLLAGFAAALTPANLLFALIGCVLGTLIGVLPGLGPAAGTAILIPLTFRLDHESRYLWTLPMFHCSGWTYTWAVTAAAGTHVCLRRIEPRRIFELVAEHRVTHMCGAPIVLNTLIHAPDEVKRPLPTRPKVMTGGAAPPSAIIRNMEAMGFEVLHAYGTTESYGPSTTCVHMLEWDRGAAEARYARMARQGVPHVLIEDMIVADPRSLAPVPRNGEAIGEIMLRGNTLMKGYLKNPQATEEAFAGGFYHSGDLAAWHPDAYIEVKDRSKDIIISGGENISSLEVEEVLYRHPQVMGRLSSRGRTRSGARAPAPSSR